MAQHKGAPKVAGRKKGVPNKATAKTVAAIEQSGLTPLAYMLEVMRQDIPEGYDPIAKVNLMGIKMDAAKSAAPYVHPKLSQVATTLTGKLTIDKIELVIVKAK